MAGKFLSRSEFSEEWSKQDGKDPLEYITKKETDSWAKLSHEMEAS